MKVNEVARLTGVTVRALHHYDKIDLLKPSEINDVGYRLYNSEDIKKLQQILFFKELDFSLSEIKLIMENPNYNEADALQNHKKVLSEKRNRLDGLINLVDNILNGESKMDFEKFDMTKIEEIKKKYAYEAKERWGNSNAYKESEQKTSSYDSERWNEIKMEAELIFEEFSECRGETPESESCQNLVEKWKNFISDNFYECNNEILAGLGLMYVNDERFKENIDLSGEGIAELMSKAIDIYCKDNK